MIHKLYRPSLCGFVGMINHWTCTGEGKQYMSRTQIYVLCVCVLANKGVYLDRQPLVLEVAATAKERRKEE